MRVSNQGECYMRGIRTFITINWNDFIRYMYIYIYISNSAVMIIIFLVV